MTQNLKDLSDRLAKLNEDDNVINARFNQAHTNALGALSAASEAFESALLKLQSAASAVALLDKTSNAPDARMLEKKVIQAFKMAQKVDDFVNKIHNFVEHSV